MNGLTKMERYLASRWVTKDKRNIQISKLEDAHLDNIILFLEARGIAAHVQIHEGKKLTDFATIAEAAMTPNPGKVGIARYKNLLKEQKKRRIAKEKADAAQAENDSGAGRQHP